MDKTTPDAHAKRKALMLAACVNPEVYVCLGLILFGTAAAGWFLIGIGILFALIPALGLAAYWLLSKSKSNDRS